MIQTSGASCRSPIEPILVPVTSEYGPPSEIPLGKGAYGTVTKHVSVKHGTVAIKHISCPDNELPANAIREIATLVSLYPHKDIITILGFELPKFNVANEGTAKEVNIVMEHGMMSLSKAIKEKLVGGDNDETSSIMYQLLRGTNYMHQKDIWHRDIKPGNVIVTQLQPTIKVKLADFGLSRSGPYCGISQTQVMYTIWYRPPEILINQLLPKKGFSYDEMAETWALGIVFWDILAAKSSIAAKDFLRTKYDTNNPTNQLLLIFKAFGFGPDQVSLRQDLIKNYWAFSETDVIDTNIQNHMTKLSALVKMRDTTSELLAKMLNLNPSKRISVTEAMSSKYFSDAKASASAPETINTLLTLETRNISRESISTKLPGDNYQKQLHNYTVTAQRMLRFAHQTEMIKDLGTFSLSITLFHCIISLEKTQFENLKNLYAAGLVCCTLAGKYYARNYPQIESVVMSLGDGTNPKIVADFETYAFKQLHGKLHQPSAYRFLVEMLSCQRNTSSKKLLFAWSFGMLCSIECSKAVFVGKPSDLARLAIQIAAHYLKHDLSEHPLAAMEMRELQQGARIVHGTFSTLNPEIRQTFVTDISKTIQMLIKEKVTLTDAEFLLLLEGKLHSSLESDEDSEDTDSPEQNTKKRKAEEFEFSPVQSR